MYEVNFPALKSAAEHLQNILSDLKKQIEELAAIEQRMMNENVWRGDARTQYVADFDRYESALASLYNEAVKHLEALYEEMEIYMRPERG